MTRRTLERDLTEASDAVLGDLSADARLRLSMRAQAAGQTDRDLEELSERLERLEESREVNA